jgi:hypothetical protein
MLDGNYTLRGVKRIALSWSRALHPLTRNQFGGGHVRRYGFFATAKLMVDQVCCFEPKLSVGCLLSGFADSRVMMLPDCSCETGTQETNLELIKDVNGRRIGKVYGGCPSTCHKD